MMMMIHSDVACFSDYDVFYQVGDEGASYLAEALAVPGE